MTPVTFIHKPRCCNFMGHVNIFQTPFSENITHLVLTPCEKFEFLVCFTTCSKIHHIRDIRGGSQNTCYITGVAMVTIKSRDSKKSLSDTRDLYLYNGTKKSGATRGCNQLLK